MVPTVDRLHRAPRFLPPPVKQRPQNFAHGYEPPPASVVRRQGSRVVDGKVVEVHAGHGGANNHSRQAFITATALSVRPVPAFRAVDLAVAEALDETLRGLQAAGDQWSNRALARRLSARGKPADERRVREWRAGGKPIHVRTIVAMGEQVARMFWSMLTARLWDAERRRAVAAAEVQLVLPGMEA